MVRWVFGREENSITCEVDFIEDQGYDVSLVPHWDVSAAAIEHYDSAVKAMGRHAELARGLRDGGWTLTGSISRWSGEQAVA